MDQSVSDDLPDHLEMFESDSKYHQSTDTVAHSTAQLTGNNDNEDEGKYLHQPL